MDIIELQERRKKLESEIERSIDSLVADFSDDTGVSVLDVSVRGVDISSLGSDGNVRIHSCSVDLDI